MSKLPPIPTFGEELEPHHASAETLALLARRRSTVANNMAEPGPTPEQIDDLLRIATRVPDHGKLAPWRFVLFEGEARADFGKILRKVFAANNPDAPDDLLDFEEKRFVRAPTVLAVISSVTEKHKVPVWEQQLSAGAVCQSLLIAANAMGFAAQWISEWYAYDQSIKDTMGLKSGERIAGWIYIGTATERPRERPRPVRENLVSRWKS